MRESENIRAIEQAGADFMGFIFFGRSPRFVDALPSYMPSGCKRVGVFVNEASDTIVARAEQFGLDYIQLHGKETPEQCKELISSGLKLIKVFSIASADDFKNVELYHGLCEYFLFDTACSEHGGSGLSFDWSLLSNYTAATPFLLSGGIGSNDVEAIKNLGHSQLAGLDINSRFEIEPALKDVKKVKEFIKQVKKQ